LNNLVERVGNLAGLAGPFTGQARREVTFLESDERFEKQVGVNCVDSYSLGSHKFPLVNSVVGETAPGRNLFWRDKPPRTRRRDTKVRRKKKGNLGESETQ